MTATAQAQSIADRELSLTRLIDASPDKVFRAWTDPELLKRWFAPARLCDAGFAELDVRPGGANLIVMRGPDGVEMPNRGVYLEVVKNERLVFTNAYTKAWEPSGKPFMTVIVTFAAEGGKTRYTALVRHWTVRRIRRRMSRWKLPQRLGPMRRPARSACRQALMGRRGGGPVSPRPSARRYARKSAGA